MESVLLLMEKVFVNNPKSIADYKKGKLQAMQTLIGQTMGATGGQGNPGIIRTLVEKKL